MVVVEELVVDLVLVSPCQTVLLVVVVSEHGGSRSIVRVVVMGVSFVGFGQCMGVLVWWLSLCS